MQKDDIISCDYNELNNKIDECKLETNDNAKYLANETDLYAHKDNSSINLIKREMLNLNINNNNCLLSTKNVKPVALTSDYQLERKTTKKRNSMCCVSKIDPFLAIYSKHLTNSFKSKLKLENINKMINYNDKEKFFLTDIIKAVVNEENVMNSSVLKNNFFREEIKQNEES